MIVYRLQKFLENPLESKWNMTFLVVPAENFREQWNIWKGSPNRKFAFHFFQAISLIPVSGLRGRFPVSRTDLICTNGKRNSEAKFTSPEFLRTICLNRGPSALPMQMVNNQYECVPLARTSQLFATQNVFLLIKLKETYYIKAQNSLD